MKTVHILLLLALTAISSISRAGDAPDESPHAAAIRLVMTSRSAEVRKLDQSPDWWHDTKERAWSAKRPFGPGIVDSTHYFQVSYFIDGQVVGIWSVNTRTGQVAGPDESLRVE